MIPSRRRPRLATALAVLLAGVGLGTVPAPAQASTPGSRPDLGFRIGRTARADGTFVGRYRVGRQRDYRIQPRKSDAESSYHAAHRVTRVPGSTSAATKRSAWLLSTYGGTSDRITAAAVDVAVDALVRRGKWRVSTSYTARRTDLTGEGRLIRAYARIMLRQSTGRHGPYRTTVTAGRVPAGDQATVTVRVQNGQGLGPVITGQQRGLAVDVTYPGAGTRRVYLNNHGVGRAYVEAAAGRTRVTAAVHAVPDVAVLLRRPRNARASDVVVAGHRRMLRLRGFGVGVSTQALTITNGAAPILAGHTLRGTYGVTGLTGPETVDYAVYGPFTAAATSCTGTPRFTASGAIGDSGTRSLPPWSPARTGYYAWHVAAGGNSTTRPAQACGTAYLTRKNTDTRQSRVGDVRTVRVGHAFGPDITVSGFDRPEVHTVRTRVYGPFVDQDKARCTRDRLFRTMLSSIGDNRQWGTTTVVNQDSNAGFYVFRTTLHDGTFMRSSRSHCGITIHVTAR